MNRFLQICCLCLAFVVSLQPVSAQTSVFINEIHYDNTGGDEGEAIEIAGPAGTDLNGWSIVLYNGSASVLDEYNTVNLTDVIPDLGGGFGVVDIEIAGIQNGSPDGLVLFDGVNVVQFLSYEGSFTAAGGVAAGLTSIDIGVEESSATQVGESLQLGGTGTTYEDFAWEAAATNTFGAFNNNQVFDGDSTPNIVINEVDADQDGTDTAEFVELFDGGAGNTDLSGLALVFFNGSNDEAYEAFDLDGFSTDADGYFVLCNEADNVPNCDFDVNVSDNLIQNGADAIALYTGDAADYTDGTPVSTDDLIDAIVYDTNDGDDAGLAVLLNPGEPQINEDENGNKDFESSQRIPNGDGGARNTSTYAQLAPTPGTVNGGEPLPEIVINELDADQDGTDTAEFVELYDGGDGNTDLTGLVLVLFNGSDDASYESFDLDGFSTGADGYFVLCNEADNVPNCDFDVNDPDNLIQNGADAAALYAGDAADFPNDTPVTTDNLIDALVYDTSDGDDAGLLVLLNAGEAQVNEDANGNKDFESNQRIPNGAGGARNTSTYAQLPPTPGTENMLPPPDVDIVINEVDADQTSTDDAEFVELFDGGTGNTTLDGLVLVFFNGSDDASYEAFDLDGQSTNAEGYFVLCGNAANTPNCDLDVSPDENLIQNGADAVALFVGDASEFPEDTPVTTANLVDALVYDTNDGDDAALLALLNAGEAQVNEDGNGDKDNHSNSRFPNGEGGQRNTVSYDQIAPTPGTENGAVVIGGIAEIFEIQGDGFVSPFENTIVTSENNVVTALGTDGFFMQTPADRTDGLENTSDGIFVFLDAAPSVAVGDLVTVTGTVVEFFDFTEFTDVTEVLVTGTGTVPDAIVFDDMLPSPDQPQDDTAYEQYEGMLITVANGFVTGPSQSFGSDPEAEAYVVASGVQTFREPGIEFPGLTGLPVWDGNPEVFELDPDKLGLDNVLLPLGSTFSATGALGFEFGGYELWPTELTTTVATLPEPVRAAGDSEGTVASLNLFRLFDDVADGSETVVDAEEYATRLAKFSSYIRDVLAAPDIIAVQEAEKLGVLEDLAAQIQNDDGSLIYDAYLVEGNDVGGIDVGFLVRPSAVQVNAVTQLAADELLTFDGSLLHDRPPLLLEADFLLGGVPVFPIEVLAVHNRSLSGIDDDGSGERVRVKRLEQAQSIATIVQARQDANADVRLTVVGDFNAFEFSDGYVDAVGQIRGVFNPDDNLLSGDDLVNPDLTNQVLNLPAEERYSFIFRGTSQVLDHALTSVGLDPFVNEFAFGRGNAGAPLVLLDDDTTPLRASDHDGLVLYVEIQPALPGTAVLAAANSMFIGFNSYVNSGDILVQGDSDETLVADYELSIGKRAVTADGFDVKADDILVFPQALVASDVAYNTLENLGTVTGAETTPLALPVFEFPAFQSGTPTDDVLIVPKKSVVTLDAGAYGHILVRQNASLVLTGGEYDVASLTIYRGGEMVFDDSGAMRIAGKVETHQSVTIGPSDAASADASDFVLYVEGINGTNGGLFEKPAAVDIGKGSDLHVNMFAPNGSIVMNELVYATGAFLAKDVWLERNVSITLDSHWAPSMVQPAVAAETATDNLQLDATEAALPEEYALTQNYPNPFNPVTTIPFSLPEAGHVTLKVYDMLGRLVDTLIDRELNAGYHDASFDARSYPSGAYIYRLEVNNFASVKKMMLVK